MESGERSLATAPGWSDPRRRSLEGFSAFVALKGHDLVPGSGSRRQGAPCAWRASAQQKARGGIPPGPAGAVLMNTLFSKILVTRVNRKICGGLRSPDRPPPPPTPPPPPPPP